MLTKIPNTAKSVVWILIGLLSVTGTLTNITICLEEDRQVNMEIACDCPFENPEDQNSHRSLATVFTPIQTTLIDRCGPCVDISLLIKSDIPILQTRSEILSFHQPILPSTTGSLPTPIKGSVTDRPSRLLHLNNYSFSSLRTVVLLI